MAQRRLKAASIRSRVGKDKMTPFNVVLVAVVNVVVVANVVMVGVAVVIDGPKKLKYASIRCRVRKDRITPFNVVVAAQESRRARVRDVKQWRHCHVLL